jgi:hypothetical protein
MTQVDPSPVRAAGSAVAHREESLAAAGRGPLSRDIVAACDEVGARLRGPAHHR